MVKYFSFFSSIFIMLFINSFSYSNEIKKDKEQKIDIIQISDSKFTFSFNNRVLNDYEIILKLKKTPEALNLFKESNYGFIGASVMLGLGIGFSIATSVSLFASISYFAMNIALTNEIMTIITVSLLTGGLIGIFLFLPLWITGGILRVFFRIKKMEAIKLYNNTLDKDKRSYEMRLNKECFIGFSFDLFNFQL